MKLVEQLEHGELQQCCNRSSGQKYFFKKLRLRAWRRWMKNRKNDDDKPMYNQYMGYEL